MIREDLLIADVILSAKKPENPFDVPRVILKFLILKALEGNSHLEANLVEIYGFILGPNLSFEVRRDIRIAPGLKVDKL